MNPRASQAALEQRSTDTLDPALEPLSLFVLDHADGSRSVAALAALATSWRAETVRLEEIFRALDDLADRQLLEARVTPPVGTGRISRRRIGQAAAATTVALLVPRLTAARPDVGRQREEGDEKKPVAKPPQVQAEQDRKTAAEQAEKRKSSQPPAPGRGQEPATEQAREQSRKSELAQQEKAVEGSPKGAAPKTAPPPAPAPPKASTPAAPMPSDQRAPVDTTPKGQSEQASKASARAEQDSKASARAEQNSKASARAEQNSKASARAEQNSKASARAEQNSKASPPAARRSEQNPKSSNAPDPGKPKQ